MPIGTTAIGSASLTIDRALSGQSNATGSVGILGASGDTTAGLTSAPLTGSTGSVTTHLGIVIGYAQVGFVVAANGTVAAISSGVTGTSARGTVASSGGSASSILSGLNASGAIGTLVANLALTGQSLTASRGSIPQISLQSPLTGRSATAARGTLTAIVSPGPTLTGVSADDPPTSKSVLFSWAADPTPGVTNYHVELGTALGLSDAYIFNVGSPATSYTGVVTNGLYYMRVRSFVGVDAGPVSSPDVILVVSGRTGLLSVNLSKGLTGSQVLGLAGPMAAQNDSAVGLAGQVGPSATGVVTAVVQVDVTVGATSVTGTTTPGTLQTVDAPALTGTSLSTGTGLCVAQIARLLAGQTLATAQGVLGASVGPTVVAALTSVVGLSATGLEVPNTPDLSLALAGTGGTGAVGFLAVTVGVDVTIPLSSVVATGQTGTEIPSTPPITLALAGSPVTSTVGNLGVTISASATVSLTAVAAAGQASGPAPGQAIAIAGQQVAILEAAIEGGLSLIGIDLAGLLNSLSVADDRGLGGVSTGTQAGVVGTTGGHLIVQPAYTDDFLEATSTPLYLTAV